MKTLVKYWRTRRGYSIRDLHDLSGVSISAIWLTETNGSIPRGMNRRKLAQALNIAPDDLLTEDSNPEADGPKDTVAA